MNGQKRDKMKERNVAIYARVSTEHEAQLSALDNQVQYYDAILAQHPEWKLYERYIDEGITGTSTKKRKNFMRMMEDADAGRFDLIITREVSRFARNTVDTLQETRRLKKQGIEVWFTEDNIWTMNDEDGELRLTIMATLAQNESKKTSQRVRAGQMVSFKNAVPYGTGNILGYDKVGREYVINPEQAETVKLMFQLYLRGYGLRAIQFELERLGHLTAMGCTNWSTSTISHTLDNPFYCGTIVYRKEIVTDYLEQKKVKNRGQVENVIVEGKHEPLISKEDFARVQEIKKSRMENRVGNQRARVEPTSIWSKKLRCCCGSSFNRRKWHKHVDGSTTYAYQCYGSIRSGTIVFREKKGLSTEGICDTPMVQEWKLEMMAGMIFRKFWGDKHRVLTIANEMLERDMDTGNEAEERAEKIKTIKGQLRLVEKKLDNILDMRLAGDIEPEKYRVKKKELEDEKNALMEKVEELNGFDEVSQKELEDRITILKYVLDQKCEFDTYSLPEPVIDAFVDEIIVYKDRFEWHLKMSGGPGDPDRNVTCSVKGRGKKATAEIVDTNSPLAVVGST